MSIFAVLFALFGMSFLIFIHELGHYYMARRANMKVEVFSIGMGKPIISWKRNGVKWQLCYILFGGYVKIAGQELEEGKDPKKVKGGFYSKSLWDRFLVVFAGPFVNIVFAFAVFSAIYFIGGRAQPFSQHTKIIGEVDKQSAIYEEGVKEGDSIVSIDNKPYRSFMDILIQGLSKSTNKKNVVFKKPSGETFSSKVTFYNPSHLQNTSLPKTWKTMGVLAPATYITIKGLEEGNEQFAPLRDAGIEEGDRVVYVDGELVYSYSQLSDIINRDIALVTIVRDGQKMHLQIPRVILSDLRLSSEQKDEFIDAKREVNLETALASTSFLPCLVSQSLVVDEKIDLIDDTNNSYPSLHEGDKILAVNGKTVTSLKEFYKEIESRKCLLMAYKTDPKVKNAALCDEQFHKGLDKLAITRMENTIGGNRTSIDGYRFYAASTPVTLHSYLEKTNLPLLTKLQDSMDQESFEKRMSKKVLFAGLNVSDKMVMFNPGPVEQTTTVVKDTFFNLSALIRGDVSPKHLSGPLGMVKMMHDSSKTSFLAGFYWLAMISMSLAIFNLLPIPMLDGGYICFILYEAVTKKAISPKMMNRLIFPFFLFFIAIFVYVTFNDIIKVFG